MSTTRYKPWQRGFTLVEVLVALSVVAIALVAGLQSSAALTRLAQRQGDQLLAQLCADNEMAQVRLLKQMPGVGTTERTCTQAQRQLPVQVDVLPTPNPHFRRVDVRVNTPPNDAGPATTLLQLSTVVGRF